MGIMAGEAVSLCRHTPVRHCCLGQFILFFRMAGETDFLGRFALQAELVVAAMRAVTFNTAL